MRTAWISAVLCGLAAGPAAAADLLVLPVQGTNLTEGETEAVGTLLAGALAAEGASVVPSAQAREALKQPGGTAAALQTTGAKSAVETTAVRLGKRVVLRSTLRAPDGAALHGAEMTAASLDDLEPVTRRLARALLQRTTPEATRDLRTVTEREGQRPNRIFTERVMGLKTAFIWPFASGVQFDPAMSLQFDGRLETQRGFLEFGAGAMIPTNSTDHRGIGGVFAEFGGSLYLYEASASPYVGAGLVPRLFFALSDGGMRLGAYGQLGVMFLRESSTRLYAEARVTQNLLPFKDKRFSLSSQPSKGSFYPTELSLQVGIGW